MLWSFLSTGQYITEETDQDFWKVTSKKYDRNIPGDFMESCVHLLNDCIAKMENDRLHQQMVDNVYENFCKVVKKEMDEKLPCKSFQIDPDGRFKKKVKHHKPWWNSELNEKWKLLREAEVKWKGAHGNRKVKFKTAMCDAQRIFDKAVQYFKRKYCRNIAELLVSLV